MKPLILVLLAASLMAYPSFCMQASWANWVLSNWTPDWSYNASWTPQNPSNFNFHRVTFSSSSDPGYTTRTNHYMYVSNSNPNMAFVCGPESYLRSDFICERKPLYWNVASAGSLCQPDSITNAYRLPCTSTGATNCCYNNAGGDLYAFYTSATTQYPPGSWLFIFHVCFYFFILQ